MLKVFCYTYNVSTSFVVGKLTFYKMRREFQLIMWTVNGTMCEIYSQTKTLISSLGCDYKASDNGAGVRVECHRYIYHRVTITIMSTNLRSPSKSKHVQCTWGRGPSFSWALFHEMLFDEFWSSNWHLGSTLRKETRAQSLQSRSRDGNGQFYKRRILLSGEWSIWPRNKISTIILLPRVRACDGSGIRSEMSGRCQDDMSLMVIMSTETDSSIIFNN